MPASRPATAPFPVLIIGDSHTGALERGRALLAARGALPEGFDWRIEPLGTGARLNTEFWYRDGDTAVIADPQYRKRLPVLPPDDPRPAAIGLSMPLWPGRVMRDLIVPGLLPWDLGAPGRRLSSALLRRLVAADLRHILALAECLRGLGLTVFAVEAPGIFRDYRLLLHIAPAQAIALQAQVRALQAAALAAAGVEVVPLPPGSLDDEGFMRSAWRHEDPSDSHHANAEFGAARLLQIAAFLRRQAARVSA